ncbi:MAG: HPr(Ser) kinase/phosphatase, partial [Candidatus Cloacimonetes bacterium]|nr:HPr(Ser) kinase/phosphatase [Candidatus Cloacimonadota bacterium]
IIYLPVSPGKNVAVVIEVVAMNHILKLYGYDAAKVYTQKLQKDLQKKAKLRHASIEGGE